MEIGEGYPGEMFETKLTLYMIRPKHSISIEPFPLMS